MWQYVIKIVITVALVIAVTEVGKRSSLLGAVLTSLPITSLLAFVWIYAETGNSDPVAALSQSIFWLVLATLPLFVVFPALLHRGLAFWPALAAACAITVATYLTLVWALARMGVRL
ncbi:MAG: DUF3147 family protein [Rudaea sp.]